ncbi:MAG TPA: hypothetical protein VGH90_06000 [Chthoniobacteraceae bacterium]|jgi:hypothetical protein
MKRLVRLATLCVLAALVATLLNAADPVASKGASAASSVSDDVSAKVSSSAFTETSMI